MFRIVNSKRIGISMSGLVLLLFLVYCSPDKGSKSTLAIHWTADRAVAISMHEEILESHSAGKLEEALVVTRMNDTSMTRILGNYEIDGDTVTFRPLIPFTFGAGYDVYWNKRKIGFFTIPGRSNKAAPSLLNIYPGADTLPQNLLKFYLEFSQPMAEGSLRDHLVLIKDGHDTLTSVFMDMEQELWNDERTILTVWLDPGRIKRDLQPNKALGPPLNKGSKYQLLVKKGWLDSYGAELATSGEKQFFVVSPDTIRPLVSKWTINVPLAGTVEPLVVKFNESLDHIVAENSIQVLDKNRKTIDGTILLLDQSTALQFVPTSPWTVGNYLLVAEPRLEDLAGNNLTRLFDEDASKLSTSNSPPTFERSFRVK